MKYRIDEIVIIENNKFVCLCDGEEEHNGLFGSGFCNSTHCGRCILTYPSCEFNFRMIYKDMRYRPNEIVNIENKAFVNISPGKINGGVLSSTLCHYTACQKCIFAGTICEYFMEITNRDKKLL